MTSSRKKFKLSREVPMKSIIVRLSSQVKSFTFCQVTLRSSLSAHHFQLIMAVARIFVQGKGTLTSPPLPVPYLPPFSSLPFPTPSPKSS